MTVYRMKADSSSVTMGADIIRKGGIVGFPTETVYGLGADAFNPAAIARIFFVKERPRFDPLIVHIHSLDQLGCVAADVPERAQMLIDRFWPGPLTIIVPKRKEIPDIVTAGLPNVALRMPDHPVALDLLRKAGTPVAAPSANRFGRISPTCARHVHEQLGNQVDLIIDGGACRIGMESTVVSFVQKEPVLLRPGGLAIGTIEEICGPLAHPPDESLISASPGRIGRHYAPSTPIVLGATPLFLPKLKKGLLTFMPEPEHITKEYGAVEILSATGNLDEAACNFFAALHRLDAMRLDVILAKLLPERDLGIAINDRLRRASRPR